MVIEKNSCLDHELSPVEPEATIPCVVFVAFAAPVWMFSVMSPSLFPFLLSTLHTPNNEIRCNSQMVLEMITITKVPWALIARQSYFPWRLTRLCFIKRSLSSKILTARLEVVKQNCFWSPGTTWPPCDSDPFISTSSHVLWTLYM